MPRFKEMPTDPEQIWLMPPSLDEMVPKDSDARVLSEVMDHLDFGPLEASYFDVGRPAYPPKVLTKVLVYAYSKGIRSSRRIEELVECDVRYMWLAGGLKPDFHTIARFRKGKFRELSDLYADSVRVCKEAGLVLLNLVAVDGTKIEANAGRKSLYDRKRLDRELEAVERVLREAEEVDRQEDEEQGDSSGREMPEHLRDAKERKALLDELERKLKANKRKIISSSDEESRMIMGSRGVRPSYNVQAVVDEESQVVVAAKVVQSEHDHGQLPEMLQETEKNTGIAPCMAVADAGYYDEGTLEGLEETKQEALIVPKEQPQAAKRDDLFASRCFLRDPERDVLVCPAGRELTPRGEHRMGSGVYRTYQCTDCQGCSFRSECITSKGRGGRLVHVSVIADLRETMRSRAESEAGKMLLALRKQIVEPVFGQLKHNRQFDRFLLRGVNGASAEVAILFLVHNLKKFAGQRDLLPFHRLLHGLFLTIKSGIRSLSNSRYSRDASSPAV